MGLCSNPLRLPASSPVTIGLGNPSSRNTSMFYAQVDMTPMQPRVIRIALLHRLDNSSNNCVDLLVSIYTRWPNGRCNNRCNSVHA